MRMKDEGYYTLIEMKDEFSEAGEPVPIRRRPLYPAELWVRETNDNILYGKREKKSIQKRKNVGNGNSKAAGFMLY